MQQVEAFKNEAFEEGSNPACRENTLASHRRAVERVITSARERLCEPISLRDMSRVAYISTFHFNRVFHQVTGLPPAKFISAMRLDEAKRLLLNTHMSITDICFEVGYNSLSTFTRLFTQRVGLGPREFRYLAERITPASVESLCAHYAEMSARAVLGHRLRVSSSRSNLPQGRSSSVSSRHTYRRVALSAALCSLRRAPSVLGRSRTGLITSWPLPCRVSPTRLATYSLTARTFQWALSTGR